jgi:HNH endonuclease
MSRLDRWKVWYQWNYNAEQATCPVCKVKTMLRDDSKSWHREHIISCRVGGPDVFPNIVPICASCNLKSNQYDWTFDYMMDIGTMNAKQSGLEKQRILNEIRVFISNLKCEYMTLHGNRCKHGKFGKSQSFCWTHHKKEYGVRPMDCSE